MIICWGISENTGPPCWYHLILLRSPGHDLGRMLWLAHRRRSWQDDSGRQSTSHVTWFKVHTAVGLLPQ